MLERVGTISFHIQYAFHLHHGIFGRAPDQEDKYNIDMNNIIIFYISTIPAGISLLLYLANRKKLKKLMKRENPKYTGHVNNSIDAFRILKTVRESRTINKDEKKFLIKILLFIGISWLSAIIWIVLFIFYSETILN